MTTTLARPDPTMTHDSYTIMLEQATRFVQSGLLPPSVKTPQAALLLMTMGKELGVPSTYALRNIAVINGKVAASAELMLALIQRDHGQQAIRVAHTDNEACTVEYRQQGWSGTSSYTFTMEDAKRAGLLKNGVWSQYPAAMLRARCISAVARMAFPASIGGLYSPDELGAGVTVTESGEVTVEYVPNGRPRLPAPEWREPIENLDSDEMIAAEPYAEAAAEMDSTEQKANYAYFCGQIRDCPAGGVLKRLWVEIVAAERDGIISTDHYADLKQKAAERKAALLAEYGEGN